MSFEAEKLRTGRSDPETLPGSTQSADPDLRRSQPGQPCPDNYLTPREMVGFLRAQHEGSKIPPDIFEHLEACTECAANWQFIATTDPELKDVHQKRVAMIIRDVVHDESLLLPGVSSAQREPLARQVEQALGRPRSDGLLPESDRRMLLESKELSVVDVRKLIADVRGIEDDKRRYEAANQLAALFKQRLERDKPNGMNILDHLVRSQADTVNLSSSEMFGSAEVAMVFFASLALVSYFRDGDQLLKENGSDIIFHLSRFHELRLEFDSLPARFEESPSQLPARASAR